MRKFLAAALVLAATLPVVACTPHQLQTFASLAPDQQVVVASSLSAPAGCVDAMREVWPRELWGWAEGIMWRESRHTPTARNASGASGCWQLMLPLHDRLFTDVGCSPRQWADARCNNRAAHRLYSIAGRSPWAL